MASPGELSFLRAVLGEDGAKVVTGAIARAPQLGPVLVPRVALAWVSVASRVGYEGSVPGGDGAVQLRKSERGLCGVVGGTKFDGETTARVAARLIITLGSALEKAEAPPRDIQRLGKSIDLITRLRFLSSAKKRAEEGEPTAKTEPPSKVAEPQAPGAPQAPDAPATRQKQPGKPLKLSEAQLTKTCPTCGDGAHIAGNRLRTCMCWMDLAPQISLTKAEGGYLVRFGERWDAEALAAFLSDRS